MACTKIGWRYFDLGRVTLVLGNALERSLKGTEDDKLMCI